MPSTGNYYKPSGAFTLVGLVDMAVFGALGALILGSLYAYADYYIPIVYLNMLLTIALGWSVGACVGRGARVGKVRNPTLITVMGFLAGVLAEYVNWVAWIFALSKQRTLALSPSDLWALVQAVNKTGAWSVFGSTPKGVELYVYWSAEALVIVGTATLMARMHLRDAAFCEPCNRWADEKETLSPLESVAEPKAFKARLEQGDFAPLKSLKKVSEGVGASTELKLQRCTTCTQTAFLTVNSVVVTQDAKSKQSKTTTAVLENLALSPDIYSALKTAGRSP